MGTFTRGEVVIIPFPFSDLSNTKNRPSLVIRPLEGDDIILCQITSQQKSDKYHVIITQKDFIEGKINLDSNIRPNKLFTADKNVIKEKIGKISQEKYSEVIKKIINLLS